MKQEISDLKAKSPEQIRKELNNKKRQIIPLSKFITDLSNQLCNEVFDEIKSKLKHKQSDVASYFVVSGKNNRLIRVETVPVLNHLQQFTTGFILVFYDITQRLKTDSRIDSILNTLTRKTRASLASIRSIIEAIREYPEIDTDQLEKFREIIHQETISMGLTVDKTASDYSKYVTGQIIGVDGGMLI